MILGQEFVRIATLTVTNYNEETGTVTAINDLGAEIIIQERDLRSVYSTGDWSLYIKGEDILFPYFIDKE